MYLYCQQVFTLCQVICNIKTMRAVGIFTVAHFFSVHIYIICRLNTLEADVDTSVICSHFVRYGKCFSVQTYRIIVCRSSWYRDIGVIFRLPWHLYICINREVKILTFSCPAHWKGNILPSVCFIFFESRSHKSISAHEFFSFCLVLYNRKLPTFSFPCQKIKIHGFFSCIVIPHCICCRCCILIWDSRYRCIFSCNSKYIFTCYLVTVHICVVGSRPLFVSEFDLINVCFHRFCCN